MSDISGKFVLRISPKLHSALRKRSEKLGLSLNALCSKILSSPFSIEESSFTPLYSEFIPRSFFNHLIEVWKDRICGIIVFGSMVRREQTIHSDVDLLLTLKSDIFLDRELYREWDIFYQKNKQDLIAFREISPQFVKIPENINQAGGLWYDIAIQGRILWQSDETISNFLQHIRETIAQGKITRHFSHGHPYWVKLNL